MKLIKANKNEFGNLFKDSGVVYDNIQKSLNLWFSDKLARKDEELRQAIIKRDEEEEEKIREKHKESAKDISSRMAQEIEDDIAKIGIPYHFERLTGALGIAMNGRCVINTSVLNSNPGMMLVVIFHELAHLYQYKKYGADFVEDLFINDEEKIEEDAQKLMAIEDTADRFGQMKANFYNKKYDLGIPTVSWTQFSNRTNGLDQLKSYLLRMKKTVKGMPPGKRNYNDIAEMLYNTIKSGRA